MRRADALSFLLVADADEFLTVAKLRALRRLWARVEQACGLEPKPIRLHAETAWRMTTRRDPWVNLLRTTIAAFSAGIGGADCDHGAALHGRARPARRLRPPGRPQHAADPARGSQPLRASPIRPPGAGGFEALTDALCEKAWALFQEIEREGGIVESLKGGALQARIAAVAGPAREGRRHPPGADHRHERVPEHP